MIDNFHSSGNEIFSNFYLVPVMFEKVWYPSTEHAYQAAKTIVPEEREAIRNCERPGAAKRMGQTVTMRPEWGDEFKLHIMESLVRQKFTMNAALRDRLMATGSEELVEGNNHGDDFWGVYHGRGKNHLGKILMKIRAELLAANWDAQVKPI